MLIKKQILENGWLKTLFLTTMSGFLLASTLPPFEIEPFIWISFVPFLFFLNQKISRKQLIIGSALTGLIYILWLLWPLTSLNSWWFSNPDPNAFLWTHKESLLKLFIFTSSLYFGSLFFVIFGLLYQKFSGNNLKDILIFSSFWVFLEFLREFSAFGFSWGGLGYVLHDNLVFIQTASIFKVYGLSFLIVAINISIYLWLINLKKEPDITQKIFNKYTFIFFILILIPTIYGFYQLNTKTDFSNSFTVAVIHSPFKTGESITIETHNLYLRTLEKALEKNPEFVLMPENALPWIKLDENNGGPVGYPDKLGVRKSVYEKLIALSQENPETTILIGLHTFKNEKNFNSIVAFENGEIVDIYQRRSTLPLFENIPKFLKKNHTKSINQAENPDKSYIKNKKGVKIASFICAEIAQIGLSDAKSSDFMINASNDSVFDNPLVARENHIMAKFRAVENKKYLLRSVKGGTSSIIDSSGKILAETSDEIMQFITAEIRI